MSTELQEKFKLYFNYNPKLTLTENKIINEDAIGKEIASIIGREGKLAISDVAKNWMRELPYIRSYGSLEKFLKGFGGMSKETKTAFVSDLLKNKEIMRFTKSDAVVAKLIDNAAESLSKQLQAGGTKMSQEFNALKTTPEKKLFLKKQGYRQDVIDRVFKEEKLFSKGAQDVSKTGKDVKIKPAKIKGEESLVAAKEEALAKESWMMRQKDRMSKLYNGGKGKIDKALKNKWIQKGFLKTTGKISKRKLLAWAAAIGVSYYVLKKWLGTQGIPEDVSDTSDSGREGTGGLRTTDGSVTSKYKACSGTYKLNCKSDVISKVQGCLGLKADGMFGPKTESALQTKIGKTEFTDADVNTICSEVVTTTTTQPKPQEDLSLPKLQTKKIGDLEPIKSNLPKELQTKTVRYSKDPIFGATTLEAACGNERLNDEFRRCQRRFKRVMRISDVELNESTKSLELIIHEALLKKTETKKKINENFRNFKNILTESNDYIVEDFIAEVHFLREIGIDNNIIEEGIGDMFSSVLGNSGSGIMQYFKVKFANWVLERLKIADPNSWIGEIISQLFAQLPIKDYGRFVSDCNFATDKISQALAESAAVHFAKQKGWDNPITGVLMQSASESLFSSQFIDSLQENLANVICPLFGQVSAKVKKAVSGASA